VKTAVVPAVCVEKATAFEYDDEDEDEDDDGDGDDKRTGVRPSHTYLEIMTLLPR
jgi:hypothetical protein